jgi:hypothetical protein
MNMQMGRIVTVKSCGTVIKFRIIGFTKGKRGENLVILKSEETMVYSYRFVTLDMLKLII